ncbi:type I-G CRISPR-associated helicase/endonuclease Cas3g [Actinomadura violacea]|uniref:Type I-U CRISPR-associated helicase/endonuclease Cas3 n=1 Tax=Actinomadura violacea TaxID=2819934 RepID=A0ABS3S8A0_9ACTN|nr:type I-U CRISPR-associated helicase/endonuclease Cas3 [Actinomadura violacea]MBO2465225.1 type I-U CRISPR-associated helicase/endonuclease Cas3 [Actinomadura violacea]
MIAFTADGFAEFVQEVHGHRPFPWQRALVERVLAEGRWPDVLDVPTGLGKTSVIDVFAFVAATRPQVARRRLFFVVDRRLIVDEAHDHAAHLAHALREGQGPWTRRVAEALRQPGDTVPLQATRMRGGVTWSWLWLERPDRFAVVVGTIDQVGSRLLFRGYGVGEHLRSIDAALVGAESLIVLDEAHLAAPFQATVQALRAHEPAGNVPTLITMSATTTADGEGGAGGEEVHVHRIGREDEAHAVAGRRLRADRRLHLLHPRVTKNNADSVISGLMAAWATALAGPDDSAAVVGVICNTVARARAVFEQIPEPAFDRVLLTGRNRPLEAAYLLSEYYDRMKAGRARRTGRPLIVVATQTIEVGANIDVDALVTESADLAALIQRLGRLNRLGDRDRGDALVVHDSSTGTDDPVYGAARQATWSWLREQADPIAPNKPGRLGSGLPVHPLALRALTNALPAQRRATMHAETVYIPALTENVLDAWVKTSPAPHPDPPVAPYLHGLGRGRPDVSLVWRSGLPADPAEWTEPLQAVPPSVEEAVGVPVGAVRRWLTGQTDTPVSALEGQPDDLSLPDPGGWIGVRYDGSERAVTPVTVRDINPGDTIVVAAERGGCDRYGWHPASTAPVTDIADLAERRGRPLLRVRPQLLHTLSVYHPDLVEEFKDLVDLTSAPEDPPPASSFRRALPRVDDTAALPFLRNLRTLASSCTTVLLPTADGRLSVLLAARGGGLRGDEGALESSTGATKQIGLVEHQAAVAARAKELAHNLGLPEPLSTAVITAARHHDEGKRDKRFQAMLHQRPLRAYTESSSLLAKSGMDPADRDAFRRARTLAEYPPGLRHEALSARIIQATAPADDLLIHLVAAHHGRSRPLLPPVNDPAPDTIRVDLNGSQFEMTADHGIDWDSPRRFHDLNQAHGRWGLALLEAIVRLADIWCSERDEEAP